MGTGRRPYAGDGLAENLTMTLIDALALLPVHAFEVGQRIDAEAEIRPVCSWKRTGICIHAASLAPVLPRMLPHASI